MSALLPLALAALALSQTPAGSPLLVPVPVVPADTAPGAPGLPGVWSSAAKTGIGTSYEAYGGEGTGPTSRVWFSLARGVVTETMFGLIHEAQVRELQLALGVGGRRESEADDAVSRVEYLHRDRAGRPLSLAYRVVSRARSGAWETEKHIFTDPDGDALFVRVRVRALTADVTPHVLVDPQMGGTSGRDRGSAGADVLHAWDADRHLVLKASRPFPQASVGFVGRSDGWTDLEDGRLDGVYPSSGEKAGNVALTAGLGPVARGSALTVDLVLGFGTDRAAAEAAADGALGRGYREVLARYNGEGGHVGWEDYLRGLAQLPRLRAQATDGGALLHASALVLKAQEDKTHPGALIASLSTPWGATVSAEGRSTGYKAVWPRDFYQVASAFLALGDTRTPLAALAYLRRVQVRPETPGNRGASGWFLQKAHVDGTPEWVGVQLDQTAMPLMLAHKLWRAGVLPEASLAELWRDVLAPAADFLVTGGKLAYDWNGVTLTPPFTQQDRWEEQEGYSPATMAALVAGLVSAGELAQQAGDAAGAGRYRAAADGYAREVEALTFTTQGAFREQGGDGRYYLRISRNPDPNDRGPLAGRNGQQGLTEELYLDAGFLELVRYGVRPADHPAVLESLPELDAQGLEERFRVKYLFRFPGVPGELPGWRRYGNDGYGEDAVTGLGYGAARGGMSAGQRGRVWPLLTGERGHYELARALAGGLTRAEREALRGTYVRALEQFANAGLMLPEQVFDGVGAPGPYGLTPGEGTDSATPLAWSHAEYVKLLRSLADGRVWDRNDAVAARYAAPVR
jgi:glucoamylase